MGRGSGRGSARHRWPCAQPPVRLPPRARPGLGLAAEPTLFSFPDIARREPAAGTAAPTAASTAASTTGKSEPSPRLPQGPGVAQPRPPWTPSQRPRARMGDLRTPRGLMGRATVPAIGGAPLCLQLPTRPTGRQGPGSSWGVGLQAGAHLVPSGPQRPAGPGPTEAPCCCGSPCAPCWPWRWACTARGPSPSRWPSRASRPGSSAWSCACGTASCSSDGARRPRDSGRASTPAPGGQGREGPQARDQTRGRSRWPSPPSAARPPSHRPGSRDSLYQKFPVLKSGPTHCEPPGQPDLPPPSQDMAMAFCHSGLQGPHPETRSGEASWVVGVGRSPYPFPDSPLWGWCWGAQL